MKKTILIPLLGDQLTLNHPVLRVVSQAKQQAQALIVMAEVIDESTHVWSGRQRSAIFLSAMRHFAKELQAAGWQVLYFQLGQHEHKSLSDCWQAVIKEHKPKKIMACEPGEQRVLSALEEVAQQADLPLEVLDDDHFLISQADFKRWAGSSKFLRMEMFYRFMRKRLNVLMQEGDQAGEPEGGQWNFDADNRESFGKKGPQNIPKPIVFTADDITRQVFVDLQSVLPDQPIGMDNQGKAFTLEDQIKNFVWPVNREQALQALANFIQLRLSRFGPTQDAMWTNEPFLLHGLISSSLNLKLLNPLEVIHAALDHYRQGQVDLPSAEGFIRQVLGWREFMRGVYWLDMPGLKTANHFEYNRKLPQWYWTGQTKMNCMSQAIGQTLQFGYAHHIQRLMVTGNFALLAGIEPQQVCDWYLAVYVDAVEWVELPNTAGMALYANGGRFTTKPYIASGAYIKRMSNYCSGCAYDTSKKVGDNACPFNTLYWDFLDRHRQELSRNPRAMLMMKNYDRLTEPDLEQIRSRAAYVLAHLDEL